MTQKRVPLGNYVTEYSVRNKDNEDIPVYSVTNSQGFCREYFGKEVASKDKTTYKIVPYGYFAYNPSRINVGSVDWQRCEAQVIVSPLYNVFSVSDELDRQFLYYFLKSNIGRQMIRAKAAGSVRDNLKLDMLKEMTIPDSSLDDQRHCVATLDNLQYLIELRKKQLNELDDLVKARFVELFENGESPIKTVEELCSAIVDCPHTTPKYEGELNNPAIRTSEIKKGYIAWETMRYVSDEEYEERTARLKPEAGDIVYGREGTFGNAAILPDGYNFCLGQRVMLLRPDYSKCTSEYLLHAVISDDVYRQALEKNNASTVAHVNVKDVKRFKIPLPSFDKQNQFASFVEQTDKSKVVESIHRMNVLFNITLNGGNRYDIRANEF